MTEKELTKQICQYLKLQYPDVVFTVDTSGLKLTIGQAVQMKQLRSSKGLPDLMIFEPRGDHLGLFIELKTKDVKFFKKDGTYKTEHLFQQNEVLYSLTKKGYCASFARGFDLAKKLIDTYMKLEKGQKFDMKGNILKLSE